MKATQAGYTVGRALESWKSGGPDRIEVFISLGYYVGELNQDGNLRALRVDSLHANEIQSHAINIDNVDVKQTLFDLRHKVDMLTKRLEALEQKQ